MSGRFSKTRRRPYYPLEGPWGGCVDTVFRYESTFLLLGGRFHFLPESDIFSHSGTQRSRMPIL